MGFARHFRELDVYKNGMEAILQVFQLSKRFPSEERYSLTDQVRRASRSVCSNTAEAWRKRRYKAAFIAKLSDAETEAAESQVHPEVAWRQGYITEGEFQDLDDRYDKILGQLVNMMDNADQWIVKSSNQS